jgi:hypothetical protein
MTDIVERLRQWPAQGKAAIGSLVIEAADEIERLRSALRKISDIDYDYQTMNDIAQNTLTAPDSQKG